MLFLFVIALFCATGYGVRRMTSRAGSSTHPVARRVLRSVSVAFGEYSLKTGMETMVDDMLDSVLPSVSQSYLPNVVTCGLHPDDVRKWGAYFGQLADELRNLIMAQ